MQASVDASVRALEDGLGEPLSDYHRGNVKARERMVMQYALAGSHNLLVLGTEHAAEAVTGFFTKYGDGACDLAPLVGLTKRQGRLLLQSMGAPARLYEKVPTADLEDLRPLYPDEASLGMSYEQIDDYLEGKSVDAQIAKRLESQPSTNERCPSPVLDEAHQGLVVSSSLIRSRALLGSSFFSAGGLASGGDAGGCS